MSKWKSKNRHKYLLQYHIIFVCKYRRNLFTIQRISDDIKVLSNEICVRHNIVIKYMETDKDHIHYMIETEPTMSISKAVNLIKIFTAFNIWKNHSEVVKNIFGRKEHFGLMDILLVVLEMFQRTY